MLQPHVAQLMAALQTLQAAVNEDDAEAAGRPAAIVHAIIHPFNDAVDAYFAGKPVPTPPQVGAAESSTDDHAMDDASMEDDGMADHEEECDNDC